jgi:hypothetical protein|tara:strand:- start:237 stop:641 length:405 start_codon:yes stop_codon:yes gene_type:complete
MKALLPRIDQVIRRHKKDWVRNGNVVTVDLKRTGRAQKVELVRTDDRYIFRSVVLPATEVTKDDDRWRRIAYRAWRRNASKELIIFAFDENNSLIGLIEAPASTLDSEEIDLYIQTVAKECDRFEYALTGEDVG